MTRFLSQIDWDSGTSTDSDSDSDSDLDSDRHIYIFNCPLARAGKEPVRCRRVVVRRWVPRMGWIRLVGSLKL